MYSFLIPTGEINIISFGDMYKNCVDTILNCVNTFKLCQHIQSVSIGVMYKYISNYVGTCDNKLNQSRLNMLQSKLRRRLINLDTLFVVILDALIQIYILPPYIQQRTRFMVLNITAR